MATLIRNGRIVTAVDDYTADVLVDGGRIRTIGECIEAGPDVEVHDAAGLLVLPGGVDVHVHLDLETPTARSVDDFASGTRAAAFGGTTTVVDFCTPARGQRLMDALEQWHRRAERACVDVAAHMSVLDAAPATLDEMKALARDEGVTSFKLYMAYPGALMVDDAALFKAMRVAGAHGALTCVHAENGPVIAALIEEALAQGLTAPKYHAMTRPPILEGEAVHRAIRLSELADAPLYVVHLSAAESLAAVTEARDRGIPVHAETCPHYLFLSSDEYERPGFDAAKFVMTPPLRGREHCDHLWRGLRTDDLQVVATDHCPFCFGEQPHGMLYSKRQGLDSFARIPNGAPGVETRFALMHDGAVVRRGMSLNRFVEIVACAPAKIFGLFPRKGTVAVGSDADLVLFDPAERWTVRAAEQHGRADYSVFEGREVVGRVKKVFVRGQCVVDGERWLGRETMGRYLRRGPSGRA